MDTEPINVPVTGTDNISGVMNGIADGIGMAFGTKMLDAVGEGIGFVTEQVGELISKASEAQDVDTLFNATIKNSALGPYKQQLLDLAEAYGKTTVFEDDTIVSTETILARYQNLSGNVMPEVLKVSMGMATMMGTDLPAAGTQLGKALEDIAGGSLSLLGRTKLLTKEQMDQAKQMATSGDAAGAQAFVLGILDKKTAGLAEDMAGTYSGKMKIFQNTLERMQEIMGGPLLDAISPVITLFTNLAQQAAPMVESAFKSIIGMFTGADGSLKPFQNNLAVLQAWWMVYGPQIKQIADTMLAQLKPIMEEMGAKIMPILVEEFDKFSAWFIAHSPEIMTAIQVIANLIVGLATSAVLMIGIVKPILDNLMWQFQNLAGGILYVIGLFSQLTGMSAPTVPPVPGHAQGGDASGWSMVGEQGPELVRLPGGSHVFSNSQSANMLQGGGNNHDLIAAINDTKIDYARLARMLRDAVLAAQ